MGTFAVALQLDYLLRNIRKSRNECLKGTFNIYVSLFSRIVPVVAGSVKLSPVVKG